MTSRNPCTTPSTRTSRATAPAWLIHMAPNKPTSAKLKTKTVPKPPSGTTGCRGSMNATSLACLHTICSSNWLVPYTKTTTNLPSSTRNRNYSRIARDRSRHRCVKLHQQLHHSQRINIDNPPRLYHQQPHQPSANRTTDRRPGGQLRRKMAHLS